MLHINQVTIQELAVEALAKLGKLTIAGVIFALLYAIESLPCFWALVEPASAAESAPQPQPAKHPREKPSYVNNSADGPTIHFTNCRENEKGHTSCRFIDADGNQHWVYLAGYKLPPLK
jgi:hypothetical protein